MSEPFILPRTTSLKDTSDHVYLSYLSCRLVESRSLCYPLVELNDVFLVLDTSLSALGPSAPSSPPLSTHLYTPHIIHADNPTAHVLFILRHPVDRLYSDYRQQFDHPPPPAALNPLHSSASPPRSGLPPIDTVLYTLLHNPHHDLASLRHLFSNHTDMAIITRFYHKLLSIHRADPIMLMVLHSVYTPILYQYYTILSPEQLILLRYEDLQRPETLHDVFHRLNLHPPSHHPSLHGGAHHHHLHTTHHPGEDEVTVPEDCSLSLDLYKKLTKFFEPFIERLENLTRLNVSYWKAKQPEERSASLIQPPHPLCLTDPLTPPCLLSRLSLYSFGYNQSLEPLWYEREEKESVSKGVGHAIVKHLLPQRCVKQALQILPLPFFPRLTLDMMVLTLSLSLCISRTSSEDSSFNTTLGMLNTF